MPFKPSSDDYWVEIPGGRFTVGLLPDEARRLAIECAEWARLHPPAQSLNGWKYTRRLEAWEAKDCNVEWLTEYLLAHFPAQEVDLAPFAIARRPVTNAEYRVFIDETGELEPWSWGHPPNDEPDRPVHGVDWTAVVAFAEWAGARLPFEAEWERAARGLERRLFPWGNKFRPVGDWLNAADRVPAIDARTATPDGIQAMVNSDEEFCADLWQEPPGIDLARWDECEARGEGPVVRGWINPGGQVKIWSPIGRYPASLATYGRPRGTFRLVRADGRRIPPATRELDLHDRAMLDVRAFEVKTLRSAFRRLQQSEIAEYHAIQTGTYNSFDTLGPDNGNGAGDILYDVTRAICGPALTPSRGGSVRAGFHQDLTLAASTYNYGLFFVARSRETFRRIPPEHGVFVWGIGYRLTEDGEVRAKHVAGYRMAFDKRIHTFTYQFRHGEVDTPIREITTDMLVSQILDAFRFYEEHADADRSPF
jgi:hypothetical protein